MAFQFPPNPVIGQQFAPATGTTYEWNGTGWIFLGLNTASLYPAGIILPYAGSGPLPFQGWLACDGQSHATSAQPALFAVIGYMYGGSGANFNVPDLRGRVIAGADNMSNLPANRLTAASGMTSGSLTGVGGAETVALTAAQAPSHAHGITDVAHAHGVNDPTHAHAVYDPSHGHGSPAHAHGVNDGGHAHGLNDPGHSHSYQQSNNSSGSSYAAQGGGPSQIFVQNTNTEHRGTDATIAGSGANISIAATAVTVNAAGTGIGIYGAGTGIGIAASGTGLSATNAAGGGAAHPNVQPTIVLNYIIKA